MLLATSGVLELLGAEEAEFAKLDSLSHIVQKTLKIDEAINIQNGEIVLESHVVDALFDTIELLVTE